MNTRCVLIALLMVASLIVAPIVFAERVDWLYEVELPVADQASSTRHEASQVALLEVLSRVTGLASVPRTEAVRRALVAPDLFYSRYLYQDQGSTLRLVFEPTSVLNLIKNADLPVWSSNRPLVVAWIVVDDGTRREVLNSASVSPLVQDLNARMTQRGVPLKLPLMDLDEQLNTGPSVVWGRLSGELDDATLRYGGDLVLVGRVQMNGAMVRSSDWVYWERGDLRNQDLPEPMSGSLGDVADALANLLAERYAVLGRDLISMDLTVSGIVTPTGYGGLLRYLGSLEYIDAVDVVQVSPEALKLSVVTRATSSQLESLLQSDGRLRPDPDAGAPGGRSPGLSLEWLAD